MTDDDTVWCANCDKQIVRTTTHGPLFDWVHRDTRKPSCEGVYARPAKRSVQVFDPLPEHTGPSIWVVVDEDGTVRYEPREPTHS